MRTLTTRAFALVLPLAALLSLCTPVEAPPPLLAGATTNCGKVTSTSNPTGVYWTFPSKYDGKAYLRCGKAGSGGWGYRHIAERRYGGSTSMAVQISMTTLIDMTLRTPSIVGPWKKDSYGRWGRQYVKTFTHCGCQWEPSGIAKGKRYQIMVLINNVRDVVTMVWTTTLGYYPR